MVSNVIQPNLTLYVFLNSNLRARTISTIIRVDSWYKNVEMQNTKNRFEMTRHFSWVT